MHKPIAPSTSPLPAVRLSLIPPDYIDGIWPNVEALLLRSYREADQNIPPTLRSDLRLEKRRLWVITTGDPKDVTIVAAGITSLYAMRSGLALKIEHLGGFTTVYAHNDVNLVEVGDRVDTGDLIALVGNTGRATTYHVHFEVRRDGLAYNPLYLLPMPPRISQIDETAQRPHE